MNNIVNTYYTPNKVIKKVTETMEYDEKGNLVKRIVVTEETQERPHYYPQWQQPLYQQHPYVSYVGGAMYQ